MTARITLNVGGTLFPTLRSTLARSDSFFSGLVAQANDDEVLFVDRDPTHFRHILNWMRGVHHIPDDHDAVREIQHEAEYYAMTDLVEFAMRWRQKNPPAPHIRESLRNITMRL